MSHHRHQHEYLDVYCCLPHEFVVAYPQSQYYKQTKKPKYRNKNALERTSSSSRLSKCKPKNLLDPYKRSKDRYTNESHTSKRRMNNKIMSIESSDHEVEFYMKKELTRHDNLLQMADGDKKIQTIVENILNRFQQQQFTDDEDDEEHTIDIIRSVSGKLSANNRLKQSCSTLPSNRISTRRKLQANIPVSHYNHIEQEQQNSLLSISRPFMLSPLIKQPKIEKSNTIKSTSSIINSNMSSASSSLSISLTDSNTNNKIIQSIDVDQSASDDDDENLNVTIPLTTVRQSEISNENLTIDNEEKLHENDSFTNISVPNSLKTDLENIEEFQPIIEIASPPSVFLNDILSSFFPTISTSLLNNNPLVSHSQDNINKPSNISNMTEILLISQPSSSLIESNLIFEQQQQPRKVHSLFESIEELCLLIRKLLHHELNEQKIPSLQATIASQLAILLTYLAIPNHEKILYDLKTKKTIDKMTSTDEDNISLVLTTETQTDIEWNIQLNNSSSSETKQKEIINILPQKGTSHTELISTSVTLGRRLNHALSDTFIYHILHHQQYSSSYHQLISLSETILHHHSSTKEKTKYLLKRIGQNLQYYIELESSNTCLEASTEFTPDFLLTTTTNNFKYDDDNDDQTEQFGIDTETKDFQTDTISLIIKKNQDKIDTLTFNSTEKENYDSLELDIEQDHEEHLLFNSFDIHQLNREKYFCQLSKSHFNICQWQLPILPRKTHSIDLIYEKRMAKINFQSLKIRSNSNNGINLIGKQVRIKLNSSSTIKSSPLNYNNNCHVSDNSKQSFGLSSTSNDSLCSFNSDTQCTLLPTDLQLLINHSESSYLSDVTNKLDSNIAIAETLLNMLNSLNNNSSTNKIDLLHMYIRQFLLEFDARIRLARKRKRKYTCH